MTDATLTIRRLNDSFRCSLSGGGKRLITAGVAALPAWDQAAILSKVMEHDEFTDDNDPHGEHDFGAFDHAGKRIFRKIDYYDPSMEFGSEDPADPVKTTRVLTIMFADEYWSAVPAGLAPRRGFRRVPGVKRRSSLTQHRAENGDLLTAISQR